VKAGYPAEFANVTTADAKVCEGHAAKMAGADDKSDAKACAKMMADGKCDPKACAKMIAEGKCSPEACAKMAADGKCDPKACANAKMTSATETSTAKGAACDVTKQAACTGHGK
jgi:hypothetical protein